MLSLKPLVELQVHRWLSDYITALVWSPVGTKLAIASGAGEVVLWQEFKETILHPANNASIDVLGFSGEGRWLAAAGQAGAVTIWRLDSDIPELVETLTSRSTWIDRLQWHPYRPWLAYNCNKTVHIWDANQGKTLATLELPAHVQDLDWSPDGNYLAISAQMRVYIWETSQWTAPQYEWPLMAASQVLKWSSEGAYLASANQDNSVGVLNWENNVRALKQSSDHEAETPVLLAGLPGKVRQLAWADIPDADLSPILATATRDFVAMWMLIPGEGWQNWLLDLHGDTVLDVAFQPQTGLLASLSEDGWILLWQMAVEPMQILEGAEDGFACLTWHPTGEYLAAGGQHGDVLVWVLCPDARQRLAQKSEAFS
ncbi:MAG: WD40 repeat domain-containing protein [Cyanobacteria bacterium P01_F01_bin.3]